MIRIPAKPSRCELCEREHNYLTRHHLIPKRLHRKKRFKKAYTREYMITSILWVCRPCHDAVHRAASELELALHYNDKQKLLENEQVSAFVAWIRTKNSGYTP